MTNHFPRHVSLGDDPLWYKDAIIYEVRVRSFYDHNADGIGDFAGLTAKLDYLQDLGVTAVWLLPFYPSPGRDDGYDISDYTDIHPDVGNLDDFKTFLAEAHKRGLRVITELVLNHTSDQHPWFRRARVAPAGSRERDYYMWSDTATEYAEARIIFKDFEYSNWTWDPVAKAYFWHRFYAHQPDLNFDNPEVQQALFDVVDFWLELGVDGLRLDAVPYLYAEEGTNCENLPATHAFLRQLRAHVDKRFSSRMLLAEANQWPEDAVAYFGNDDECQMAFHFPIMPRLFMSIHMEDRFPIVDILAQTPPIPPGCQWALFLRNHDELTLEMVTDDERDYMYRAYAHDPTMRINLGIRRRLAPLMGGDRRNVELMNALLLSLPGTPVLYYGDEIGMGDNIYLGDRNGVRTPMQWSADRNAGFSRANPQKLILPVIIDPEYHYESVNVEFQQNNPTSLLWWVKRLIALRKRYQAFGRGTIEFLNPDNPRVLAFIREYEGQTILIVANLSRVVQCSQIDLSKYRGLRPTELLGGASFPTIGDLPSFFMLAGHGFYWLGLEKPKTAEADARAASYTPPSMEAHEGAAHIFDSASRGYLEEVLAAWMATRAWFDVGTRQLVGLTIVESFPVPSDLTTLHIVVVEARFGNRQPEQYLVPLSIIGHDHLQEFRRRTPQALIAILRPEAGTTELDTTTIGLCDALADPAACRALLTLIARGDRIRGVDSELRTGTERVIPVADANGAPYEVRILEPDPLRPHVIFGDDLVLKLFRRLEEGTAPDLEIGLALGDESEDANALTVVGYLEQRHLPHGHATTLGIVREFVSNEGDAWTNARAELGRYFERAMTRLDEVPGAIDNVSIYDIATRAPGFDPASIIGPYLERMRLLGRRTAQMHRALAARVDLESFAPVPYSGLDLRSRYQGMRNVTGRVLRSLRNELAHLPANAALDADIIVRSENQLLDWFEELLDYKLTARRIRCHGNYKLSRVLYTGKDYVVMDFDGDPKRNLSERQRKRSPLYDLASMIRSLHSAAFSAWMTEELVRATDRPATLPWAEAWASYTGAAFLDGYLKHTEGTTFLPQNANEFRLVLDTFLLEITLEQLAQDLADHSDAVVIPLHFLRRMLESRAGA